MKTARRHGFTLVELLVVIAMIGILICMLLPAIQSSRESARRVNCMGNLAQLGTALQNYEAAHEVLPAGVVDDAGPIHTAPEGKHMSWITSILPYLEERVLFKRIDFAAGAYDRKNDEARSTYLAPLICPSYYGEIEFNRAYISNYAACHHDVEAPIDQDNHGTFFLNSRLRSNEIPDGATHTIFLGEKLAGKDEFGWMSGTRSTLRNTGTPLNETEGDDTRDEVDRRWDEDADDEESAPQPVRTKEELLAVGGFGSDHTDVVNFLFGDGAIRSLDVLIDQDILEKLGHRDDGELLREGPTRAEGH